MTMTAPQDAAERRDALVGRLFEATLGAFDLLTIHLGAELGLYRALAERGPLTAAELAAAAGIAPRYAREWLEQQAVAALIDVDDAAADAEARRYSLPAGYEEVLVDPTSPASMTGMAQWLVGGGASMADLIEAYRTGGGVPWDRHPDVVIAQDRTNRPQFIHSLTQDWLPALGDIDARLRDGGRPDRRRRLRHRLVDDRARPRLPEGDRRRAGPRHRLDRDGQRPPRERCPGRRRPGHVPGPRRG